MLGAMIGVGDGGGGRRWWCGLLGGEVVVMVVGAGDGGGMWLFGGGRRPRRVALLEARCLVGAWLMAWCADSLRALNIDCVEIE